jgi:hypothetical protein
MRGFFDVHPDGERIVIRKPAARQQRQENPVFVFNFFEELRSKARKARALPTLAARRALAHPCAWLSARARLRGVDLLQLRSSAANRTVSDAILVVPGRHGLRAPKSSPSRTSGALDALALPALGCAAPI